MDAELPETGGGAIALEFPVGDPTPPVKIPRRIRERLLEAKSGSPPSSVEEIEAKLKEADLRRQRFHEWLSNKARPKPRSPSWSSQEEDPGQRLEAKLHAAEQKRLSLLTKAQMRLAKVDELRQAAKTGAEIRSEKEREELGSKVESRVQQAEENRMRLLKDHMQRRAAAQERTARSLTQRMVRENKHKECIRSAILQKRIAAEKKRLRLLEEEKSRVHARVMQVNRAAKTVYHQRENERRRIKEQLENRLQRAKRQRAEYLRQRGSPHSSTHIMWNKHGDHLSRKLARCWRRFVRSNRTTLDLAKSYGTLGINEKAAKSMPFEPLARLMESPTTLQAAKALFDRLETRLRVSQTLSLENVDHLLTSVASPSKKTPPSRTRAARGMTKKGRTISEASRMSRYPARVALCAYMILGHPKAVFSGHGDQETALSKSAANFVREFELLVKIILKGPSTRGECMSNDSDSQQQSSVELLRQQTFRSQLSSFDAAWRSYLYCFVDWKVKDARSLEDDLVRTACQLELSMMQTCKLSSEGPTCDLTHDMRAIQKQVTEDQKLLRDKVQHLSGNAGTERMESALSDTRSRFFEAKDNGTPLVSPVAHVVSSVSPSGSSKQPLESVLDEHAGESRGRPNRVVRSLSFSDGSSSSPAQGGLKSQEVGPRSSNASDKHLPSENEVLVNEIVHGAQTTLLDRDGGQNTLAAKQDSIIKAKVKETMEKAFWDSIMDSMKEDPPNYSRVLDLVEEVRDELIGLAPRWKQDILDSIDMDILSQLLKSGTRDLDYLGRILEYALLMLQKLSAEAKEVEMKKAHEKLLMELSSIAQSADKEKNSFIVATVRGLRFVLEKIQVLKTEIAEARIQLIKSSTGLGYLHKVFADRYGHFSRAADSLPKTARWISALQSSLDDEWNEHNDSLSLTSTITSHGLPIGTALRTGGGIPVARNAGPSPDSGDEEQPECTGKKLDLALRLGVLKLVSGIAGLTKETVPETLELNALRLRSVQSQLQQIIVSATSLLVLRQILLSENSALSLPELEATISDAYERLTELLEGNPDVGIEEMVNAITGSSLEPKLKSRKDIIGRMLVKSLQSNDPVFMKVSRSIYLATRAVMLGGSGDKGRKLAAAALKRVGATMLLDQVVKAAKVLINVATLSRQVHGVWYASLL